MRKHSIFFRSIFWALALILGFALIVSYCSVYINPIHLWIPAFFGLYFVPLVIANALLLLIALVRRSSLAWIPFLSLLPTLIFAERFVRWGDDNDNTAGGVSVKLATYNVCNFQGYEKATRQETISEIRRFLDAEKVDIVCMQEFFCSDTSHVGKLFPSFPYHYYNQNADRKSFRGNIIFSRYPILNEGELPFADNNRSSIYVDLNLNGRLCRVYTTHFKSNNISLNAMVDRVRNYQEAPDEILLAHLRIREAFRIRANQVELITNHLQTVDIPFVFCGDLNDTPVSYTYHRLQRGLNDSFRNAGKGFGATFRYLWPTIRIDYILYSDAFSIKSHTTAKVPFSDHYPIITELIAQ